MEGLEYLVALSHFEHFGPRRLKFLFDYFGSWEKAWSASSENLLRAGIRNSNIDQFIDFRHKTKIEDLLAYMNKQEIKFVCLENKNYPSLLKEIYAPPPLLYYKGNLTNETFSLPLAVVGSRKITNYGRHVCENIISELVNNGLTIISGLALGTDALAHEITLNNHGQTVAFLGCGVDQVYPKENTQLSKRILGEDGILMSEYPPKTIPFKTNFPRRNRLIAGACLGTLIIEAGPKSGALITTRYALDENREVFSIPGGIYNENSISTNNLIKSGAKMVTEANDIINTLGIDNLKKQNTNKQILPATPEETLILKQLGSEARHVNELAKEVSLDINVINSRLTIMEMKGIVKHLGNMLYIKNKL